MIRVKLVIVNNRGDVETYSTEDGGSFETRAGAVPLIFRVVRAALAARSEEVEWVRHVLKVVTDVGAVLAGATGPVTEERGGNHPV